MCTSVGSYSYNKCEDENENQLGIVCRTGGVLISVKSSYTTGPTVVPSLLLVPSRLGSLSLNQHKFPQRGGT